MLLKKALKKIEQVKTIKRIHMYFEAMESPYIRTHQLIEKAQADLSKEAFSLKIQLKNQLKEI